MAAPGLFIWFFVLRLCLAVDVVLSDGLDHCSVAQDEYSSVAAFSALHVGGEDGEVAYPGEVCGAASGAEAS